MFTSHYATIKDQLPFFNGITPNDVVDLFTEVGLKKISVNNLEKLREFETKNRPLSYKIASSPYLFLAISYFYMDTRVPEFQIHLDNLKAF
jgi:hypothetical protein